MPPSKPLKVLLSNTADVGIQSIARYLAIRFSDTLAIHYVNALESAFDMLANMPTLGMVFQGDVRRLIWKKYTLIFYKYDGNFLYITNVEDSRSNYLLKFLS